MKDDNRPHAVSEEIEQHITDIEQDNIREFLGIVVQHERDNLALKEPDYKKTFRKAAADQLDSSWLIDDGGTNE